MRKFPLVETEKLSTVILHASKAICRSSRKIPGGAMCRLRSGDIGGEGIPVKVARVAETMSKTAYLEKEKVIGAFRTHEKDTGSSEVQIALLTARIQHVTEHLRVHRKDYHTRRGLIAMAHHRRKLLDYLQQHNLPQYEALLQRLKLRR